MPLEQHINENKESTESKIKDAAKIVFHKKGFTATRTRDIAEEAGLNLALLNYYFRSKKYNGITDLKKTIKSCLLMVC